MTTVLSGHRIPRSDTAPTAAKNRRRRLRPWLSTLAILAGWQLAAGTGLTDPRVLPPPSTVLAVGAQLVADGSLPAALGVSVSRVLVGSLAGVSLGLVLGLLAGLSRFGEDLVDKPVQMLRTIPFTALTPLLILWFGLGETPKYVLVAVATLVPVYLNTAGGVRAVDPQLIEVARAHHLGRLRTAVEVLLPGALAPVLVGLRHAAGIAWVAVIVAETVNADAGIGYLMTTARTYARTDVVMVCIAVYALLGLVTDFLVRLAERKLLRWQRPGGRR